MLGVPAMPWGTEAKEFGHQTLRDNVALLDNELLQQINACIAAAGREVFAKKGGAPVAALELKVDSYVLETDVHFPTDLNLLWDAGRKCVDLVEKFRRCGCALPGWRKAKEWRRQLKNRQRTTSQIIYRGGPNKEARVKKSVREYLAVGRGLSAKVQTSLIELCDQPVGSTGILSPDARQASGPGGAPFVERGNHSGTRESIFPLRTAHRVDSERQAAPQCGIGAQAVARDRPATIDSGLRHATGPG
jgi:hypothetical protein